MHAIEGSRGQELSIVGKHGIRHPLNSIALLHRLNKIKDLWNLSSTIYCGCVKGWYVMCQMLTTV